MKERMLSIVIPVYNEQDNVLPLHERIKVAMGSQPVSYEIIFVNDGSSDGTGPNLEKVVSLNSNCKVVNFKRNFGQTAAMMAGIDFAQGEIIVGLDGDLQNDPGDIPKLVAKLD